MSSKKPKLTDLDPTVVSEVFTRRVAVLAMTGRTSAQIGEELGFTAKQIAQIQSGETYKKYVAKTGEQEMVFATSRGKTQLAGMIDDATKVMRRAMKDFIEEGKGGRDAIVAAQTVIRATGLDRQEDKTNDTNLTVILPGGSEPVTFKAEIVDEKED